jgi:hypothetical protein
MPSLPFSAPRVLHDHRPQALLVMRHVRSAYLQRFPQVRRGWTLGHAQRLLAAVLGLPAWAPANHPTWTALQQLATPLHAAAHQMLFEPGGAAQVSPELAFEPSVLLARARRLADQPPMPLLTEALAVLLEGHVPEGNDAATIETSVARTLLDVEPALDSSLSMLQVHAALYSSLPLTARTCEQLLPLLQSWAEIGTPTVREVHRRLLQHIKAARRMALRDHDSWRHDCDLACGELYDQCRAGLGLALPPLDEQLQVPLHDAHYALQPQLAAAMRRCMGRSDRLDEPDLQAVAHRLFGHFVQLQRRLRVADVAQRRIEQALGQRAPRLSHSRAAIQRQAPDLATEMAEVLDLEIAITAERLRIGPLASELAA